MLEILYTHYVNGKILHVETIPGMRERGNKGE
jgi:hypothetical protein